MIPVPMSFVAVDGQTFELTAASRVAVTVDDPEVTGVAERFADWLRRSTGFEIPVGPAGGSEDVVLDLGSHPALGDEGYTLRIDNGGVRVSAATAEGVFRGLTSLRQLLPETVEAATAQPGPWTVGGAEIRDRPRFAYRGVMLDVARHFFDVEEVLRLVELASLYKINHLHLHLTDDQGWRLAVAERPLLTEIGGPTDIDGGPGGSYTEEDFARIVRHAAERYVRIVPEIDLPGHTTAALRAYPELADDRQAPAPYTQAGIAAVSLSVGSPTTWDFLADVFDAVAAQSPGRFVHIGADEAIGTDHDDYRLFVRAVSELVVERGKRVIAWHEAAQAELLPGTVIQYWGRGDETTTGWARDAASRGHQLILSPANHAYLDMQYDADTPHGLTWAGYVPVSASYAWDPGTLIDGVPEESVLGVESALWTETVTDRDAMDVMAFPRLAGVAEAGWSPTESLVWADYRSRLAAHGRRWDVFGVNYFRSPEIPWPER